MNKMHYSLEDLQLDFPDNDACLQWILEWLYPDGYTCPGCGALDKLHKVPGRPLYACICAHQISPMAGTIFEQTTTPLTKWFYAIYLMSATRCGVSAMQIMRELSVTYKTAWRMMHQIRKLMAGGDTPLTGEVEVDETYLQAKPNRRTTAGKKESQIIFGMVQRNGHAKLRHVRSSGSRALIPAIEENVAKGTEVYSDEWKAYKVLKQRGYTHAWVTHSRWQFRDCWVYTQNVENLWSHLKRGIRGVYRHVSPKYLQAYANEFAFRYSHRNDYKAMFWSILCELKTVRT
jgi:transposase